MPSRAGIEASHWRRTLTLTLILTLLTLTQRLKRQRERALQQMTTSRGRRPATAFWRSRLTHRY